MIIRTPVEIPLRARIDRDCPLLSERPKAASALVIDERTFDIRLIPISVTDFYRKEPA